VKVAASCPDVGTDLSACFSQLVEIHTAPRWACVALVPRMVDDGLTVSESSPFWATFA
jgi:hypothetical protein